MARRLGPAAARGRPRTQPSVLVDARGRRDRHADRQRAPDLPLRDQIAPVDEARDRRDRGPPLLHQQRRRPARHRPRRRPGRRPSGGAVQGASTIPQQFVKISLAAENERTVFQKLREAALAYQLTRRWSKERILRNYLNSIYFGNGAYGIESAARTYFAYNHDGCGEPRRRPAVRLGPAAARGRAAGRRWSPRRARIDPTQHPVAAKRRRDLVLLRMYEQGYLTRAIYESEKAEPLPDARRPDLPEGGHGVPVLHLLDQAAGRRPLGGGQQGAQLRVRGRPAGQDDDRLAAADRRAEGDRRLAAEQVAARAPRSSRSPTRTAWCGRWSAATTTASRRSTSPRRASASPAPRSSRSCSPRRSSRASARTRPGSPRS